jgi:hypothetical protein
VRKVTERPRSAACDLPGSLNQKKNAHAATGSG